MQSVMRAAFSQKFEYFQWDLRVSFYLNQNMYYET
jgi:hypothetical protein